VLHIYAIFESEVLAFNEIEASQFVKKNLDRSWLSPPTRVSEPGHSLGFRPSSATWQCWRQCVRLKLRRVTVLAAA
jgi:hypothetical protein